MTYLGMQVIEGLALAAFANIRDRAQNQLAAAVNAYVMQDEARHVAFGPRSFGGYTSCAKWRACVTARATASRRARPPQGVEAPVAARGDAPPRPLPLAIEAAIPARRVAIVALVDRQMAVRPVQPHRDVAEPPELARRLALGGDEGARERAGIRSPRSSQSSAKSAAVLSTAQR